MEGIANDKIDVELQVTSELRNSFRENRSRIGIIVTCKYVIVSFLYRRNEAIRLSIPTGTTNGKMTTNETKFNRINYRTMLITRFVR